MELYFAPLEGIGGYIHRNAHAACFPKADKYFAPFLSPNQTMKFQTKELKDVDPANNEAVTLIPQLLTNHADYFLWGAQELVKMGYHEINLNLGCPSKTVVPKGRGAGALADLGKLDLFLDDIFRGARFPISIKTRIGMESEAEFGPILDIFSKYPIHELTIHPRVQTDYYKNEPRMAAIDMALDVMQCPIVYNGDICSASDLAKICDKYPKIEKVMIGRGALRDPGIFGECRSLMAAPQSVADASHVKEGLSDGFYRTDKDTLRTFHDRLLADYCHYLSGEKTALFKLKETWTYMGQLFEEPEKALKKIRKATRVADYRAAVDELFQKPFVGQD